MKKKNEWVRFNWRIKSGERISSHLRESLISPIGPFIV
jgi:hypothetical protein